MIKATAIFPKILFRTDEKKLFKYSKQGILMRYKEGFINLSIMLQEEDNDVLDMLYSLLDEELTTNQKYDIKELIKEIIDER